MANDRELELLAKNLFLENRSNPNPDEAAGIVRSIYERQQLQGYPDTVEGVLTQPGQYHGFQPPAGNEAAAANALEGESFGPNHPDYVKFMTLAQHGWQQRNSPQANPPTHYFTGPTPGWAQGMELTRLGEHSFGREQGRKRKAVGSPKPAKKKR